MTQSNAKQRTASHDRDRDRDREQRESKRVSTPASRAREPRLTKEQLTAWAGLTAPAWASFKEAWLGRGLRMPPTHDQRDLLWEIADARPTDLARWVRESPSPVAANIVEYVLGRWTALRDAIDEALDADELEWLAAKGDERQSAKRAMQRIGELLPR